MAENNNKLVFTEESFAEFIELIKAGDQEIQPIPSEYIKSLFDIEIKQD